MSYDAELVSKRWLRVLSVDCWNTASFSRYVYWNFFPPLWCCGPTGAKTSSFLSFLDHAQRHITVGRTPLDEGSARRRDLYLTTHNTHNRQKSMPPVGFEPKIAAGERPQTYALDRAATGTGREIGSNVKYFMNTHWCFTMSINPAVRMKLWEFISI